MNQTSLVGRPLHHLVKSIVAQAEKRGIWRGPYLTSSHEGWAEFWGTNTKASTGMTVNEGTAYTYSVFWACVNNISTDIAAMPLKLYKKLPNGGKEELPDHKLFPLLHDAPNPEMTAFTFRGLLTSNALTWGMGYAEIVRDGAGRVAQLWPITPDRVTMKRMSAPPYSVYYEVTRENGGIDRLSTDQMFVLPGSTVDGVYGRNIVTMARESIGLGLAAERFGGTFYGNGSTFGGAFEHPGRMSEQALKNFRDSVNAQHQGVDRAHKFIVVEEGMKYQKLGVDPDHAQFIETRQHQIEEMCRWFRMPPHKVQHLIRTSYNSVEQMNIEYSSDTLQPRCVSWEQELKRQLIAPSERKIQFFKHNMDSKLRGDQAARAQFYQVMRNIGAYSADDVREKEDMNPLPNGQGKVYLVPLNMSPADRLDEIVDKQVAPDPKPVVQAPKDDATAKDDADRAAAQMRETLRTALAEVEARIAEHATARATAEANFDHTRTDNEALRTAIDAHKQAEQLAREEAARIEAAMLLEQERAARAEAERDAVRAEHEAAQAQLKTADEMLAGTSRNLIAATEKAQALEAERATLLAASADLTGKLADLQVEHARALVELQTAAESERTAAEQCVTELRTLMTQAEQQRDARGLDLAKLDGELATAKAHVETVTSELETLRAAAAAKDAEIVTFATTKAEAQRAHEAAQRIIAQQQEAQAELEAALQTQRAAELAQADALAAANAGAVAFKAMAESCAADASSMRAALDKAMADYSEKVAVQLALEAEIRTLKDKHAAKHQAMITEHWKLVAEGAARQVRVEVDRARRNQGTPAKLLAWSEPFYMLQEDRWVEALRPAMRAVLVFMESDADVDTYTRDKVRPSLMAAVAQIRAVASGDPDEFPVALEHVLTRWERERAAAIADAVVQEEMTYVRSL